MLGARDLERSPAVWQEPLLRRWTVATFLGETLGFSVPGVAGAAGAALELPDAAFILLMIGAGSVEGATLGLAQSIGMERDLPAVPRRDWVRATAVAAAVAWALGMSLGTQMQRLDDVSRALAVALAGAVGLVIVLSIGTAQWSVLRRRLRHAAWWIPANAFAWLLGVSFVFAGSAFMSEDTPAAIIAAVGVLSGAAMAATVAIVTGAALAWLKRSGQR